MGNGWLRKAAVTGGQILLNVALCFLSAYWGYRYGERQSRQAKMEQVLEEISVLMDGAHGVECRLRASMNNKEPTNQRRGDWQTLAGLYAQFEENQQRYEYLLEKYYGSEIRKAAMWAMGDVFSRTRVSSGSAEAMAAAWEKDGTSPDSILAYGEVWGGWISGVVSGKLEKASGIRFRMMEKCGIDVSSLIRETEHPDEANPWHEPPKTP